MISVLIPVFNEESLLESSARIVHDFMIERGLDHEILVVSNGSTDRTNQIGAALAEANDWFRFFVLPEKGVGRAFVKAVREARGELLVSLDADLSFDLEFVDYASHLLRHADVLIGSKTMGKQRRRLLRIVASQAYIAVAQAVFGLTVSDYSIGCKAYRREAIVPVLEFLDSWTGYVFELCLYANVSGLKILQIGVDCDDRRRSHFNLVHEGIFRYVHLFKCWRMLRSKDSWIHNASSQS